MPCGIAREFGAQEQLLPVAVGPAVIHRLRQQVVRSEGIEERREDLLDLAGRDDARLGMAAFERV